MNFGSKILLTTILLIFGVVFLRFGRAVPFLFLITIFLLAFAFGFGRLINWWRESRDQERYRKSPEGRAEYRINDCKLEIGKIKQEIRQIEKDIQDLENSLSEADLDQHKEKSKALIKGFRKEIEIRQAKIKFLESAINRMEQLLQRYRLKISIQSKEDKLKKLQENHFEDIAQLENLKSDVELDVFLLDDIEELQLKTLQSTSIQNIETLQQELESMTKDLEA